MLTLRYHLNINSMRHLYILIILFSFITVHTQAQDMNSALDELDKVIRQKEKYRKMILNKADSITSLLTKADRKDSIDIYCELYSLYNNFQVDSALHYVNKLLSSPEIRSDNNKSQLYSIKKAVTYGLMGDFCSSMQIVDTIDITHSTPDIRREYFYACRTIYGWNAEFVKNRHDNYKQLERLTQMYRDSILENTEYGVSRNIVLADNCIVNGDADSAISILLEILSKSVAEQKVYAYYLMSQSYKIKKDRDKYVMYLAMTAMSDIRNGITEYTALPELANVMYERGDITRAYNYLFCSMEDAHFCNAFLRTIEVNNIFPIIDKEYKHQEERRQLFEHTLLTGVSVLTIILIFGIFYLQNQIKKKNLIRKKLADINNRLEETNAKLASTNGQLENANSKLQHYNTQLAESYDLLEKANGQLENTNKVKEEYIAHYLGLCREYMDTFENFRKSLLKMAKNNQSGEMLKMLKSDAIIEDEQKKFYADFDKTFLNIHPKFIEEFYALIDEEMRMQITPKKGELLSIELRIFALIRLGVEDSAMIAHFLDYSLLTIYNYRSRIIKKSPYSKEEFMARLMATE